MEEVFAFRKSQKVYLFFKRLLDILGSFFGIVLLGIPMIVLAIITKCTSKGPALYKQKRIGKGERLFTMYKFRSMRADAPAVPPSELSKEEQTGMITKWGRFLRRTSMDELPQLFNIFLGQMSFIGPRPQQDKEHEGKCYEARMAYDPNAFMTRPGLCSLAIVKMHRDHDPEEKAKYDSEYIRKLSFKMDAYVFFCAIGILLGLRPKDKGR